MYRRGSMGVREVAKEGRIAVPDSEVEVHGGPDHPGRWGWGGEKGIKKGREVRDGTGGRVR